ncbi:MAG: adenylosuccinate lyase, partial [Pseudomonadota bacterium]
EAGLDRQEAYEIVQRHAMRAWEHKLSLFDLLRADPDVTAHLNEESLAEFFRLEHHTEHVDHLFERVFGQDAAH